MTGSWAASGAGLHGMLFLEAFGQLSRDHDRKGMVADEEDLYGVFSARANLMGWSITLGKSSSAHIAEPRTRHVLWWMHEGEWSAEDRTSRIGWVQVGLETGVEPAQALPALLQCFDDALRRFGVVELSGLQVTASYLQAGKESSAWDLVSGLSWFSAAVGVVLGPPADALIAFDSGLLQGRSELEFVARLQRMTGGLFEFGPLVPVPRQQSIEIPAEVPSDVVLSPAERGMSVRLPEWSASSAAWVLAVVIDIARAGRSGTRNFAVRLTRVE